MSSDVKSVLRVVVMIALALFVLFTVVPVVLKLVGLTVVFLIWLAVKLIYLAVVLAVAYLILAGIRAILR